MVIQSFETGNLKRLNRITDVHLSQWSCGRLRAPPTRSATAKTCTDPAAAGDLRGEITTFLDAGMDGLVTDNPDIGDQAADRVQAARDAAARASQ